MFRCPINLDNCQIQDFRDLRIFSMGEDGIADVRGFNPRRYSKSLRSFGNNRENAFSYRLKIPPIPNPVNPIILQILILTK